MTGFNFSPLNSGRSKLKRILSKRRFLRFIKEGFLSAVDGITGLFPVMGKTASTISSKIPPINFAWTTIGQYTVLFLFGAILLQPSKFTVQKDLIIPGGAVYAQIDQNMFDEHAGELQLELLVPGDDVGGEIVYVVRSGDTLSEIAKNFGTTTRRLQDINGFSDADELVSGQKIAINTTRDQIIYEVQESTTIAAFAASKDLDLGDLMTLNYIDDASSNIEPGYQLFLDLTQEQAKSKGLRQAPVYVRPEGLIEEMPEGYEEEQIDTKESDRSISDVILGLSGKLLDEAIDAESIKEKTSIQKLIDQGEPQQRIITSEDTSNQLENQKKAIIEAIKREKDEAEKEKLELQKRELEAKIKKEEQAKEAQQAVITAEQTTDTLENPPEPEVVEPVEVEQVVIKPEETTQQIEQLKECGTDKCLHKDSCRSLPSNASCAPNDSSNAWVCWDGYVETNRKCIEQSVYDEQVAARGTEPAKDAVSSQWYFNPYNDGYSNGRAGGHCTHYAGWYRWKHYGIMTNRRGNGGQRYRNASAAGRQVGQTPEVGAIFVGSSGSGVRSSYGHVGVVTAVDWKSNSIKVSDMNYAGRYIVTERWMPISSAGMIGYVYPRKK